MNKQEITIVALLVALLLAWMFHQSQEARRAAARAPVRPAVTNAADRAALPDETALSAAPETAPAAVSPSAPAEAPAPAPAADNERHALDEARAALTNGVGRLVVSSWGGGIVSAEFPEYRQTLDPESPPVLLDFAEQPALALKGIPGLSTNQDFAIAARDDGGAVTVSRQTGYGLAFARTLEWTDDGRVRVTDVFSNAAPEAIAVPEHVLELGPMSAPEGSRSSAGMVDLGVDSLSAHGGEGVRYWANKRGFSKAPLDGAFRDAAADGPPPQRVAARAGGPVVWLATKNKFFVQILTPEEGQSADAEIHAARDLKATRGIVIDAVAGGVVFPEKTLGPGAAVRRSVYYYAGPKKYAALRRFGQRQDEVMQFGMFAPICRLLLNTLNGLYGILPNYGVAIIVLTALVRVVFWPVTRKSAHSMKKMQAMQPQIAELRQKFKDKPQRMNQEIMALYKAHKVNPAAGCLPMLVQIPVFIALFNMLRGAIELRFAPFLWIRDLSEQEGLLAGVLPIPLNILPLVMTAATIVQQKLTPSGGDPQQQKMMTFMPLIFLFMFYTMPSALVLYWLTSQLLSLIPLVWNHYRGTPATAAAPAAAK